MLIYINDMLNVGKQEAVNEAIQALQQSFEVKPPTKLEDYLGTQEIKCKEGEKAWLGQPTIIKSLENVSIRCQHMTKYFDTRNTRFCWAERC